MGLRDLGTYDQLGHAGIKELEQWAAVIEAAKAWRKNFDFDGGSGAEDEILRDAIDDWLAAEVEHP